MVPDAAAPECGGRSPGDRTPVPPWWAAGSVAGVGGAADRAAGAGLFHGRAGGERGGPPVAATRGCAACRGRSAGAGPGRPHAGGRDRGRRAAQDADRPPVFDGGDRCGQPVRGGLGGDAGGAVGEPPKPPADASAAPSPTPPTRSSTPDSSSSKAPASGSSRRRPESPRPRFTATSRTCSRHRAVRRLTMTLAPDPQQVEVIGRSGSPVASGSRQPHSAAGDPSGMGS